MIKGQTYVSSQCKQSSCQCKQSNCQCKHKQSSSQCKQSSSQCKQTSSHCKQSSSQSKQSSSQCKLSGWIKRLDFRFESNQTYSLVSKLQAQFYNINAFVMNTYCTNKKQESWVFSFLFYHYIVLFVYVQLYNFVNK